MGHGHEPHKTTQEHVDDFREALEGGHGMVRNHIREHVKMAKLVYAWGKRRKHLAVNELGE